MSNIKVFADNKRTYSIVRHGNVIGNLEYKYWYSAKAKLTIGKNNYTIVRKGFWGKAHEVRQGDDIIFNLKAQWDGGIAIIKPNDKNHFYGFKPKGLFINGYVLTNYKNEELLMITADFSCNKFTSGYTISCSDNFGLTELEQLLIMITVYHYKAAQAMAIAATAN